MRIVSFNEFVPGMVLHPVVEGEGAYERNFNEIIVLMQTIPAGTDKFWGDKSAMLYIPVHDAYHGACYSSWGTGPDFRWEVIDDQETLDKVRAAIKTSINRNRDHLEECERFVDKNL